jgi:ArsR family transcriptional regulator, arsenate/arsenite/antimonite-responsive transcriptional repressor
MAARAMGFCGIPRNCVYRPLDTLINIDTMMFMSTDVVTFAKAIADDTRQEIMKHLCCVWLSVNDVVDKLEGRVNQPTVSHHLKKLEEANLVMVRQEGRHRFYTLNQEELTVCCGMLVKSFAPNFAGQVILPDEIK